MALDNINDKYELRHQDIVLLYLVFAQIEYCMYPRYLGISLTQKNYTNDVIQLNNTRAQKLQNSQSTALLVAYVVNGCLPYKL